MQIVYSEENSKIQWEKDCILKRNPDLYDCMTFLLRKIVFLLLFVLWKKSVTVVENDKMRKLKMNSFDHGIQNSTVFDEF